MKDKRFKVGLKLEVHEVKDGEETPFFENDLCYHDMPYDGVVALESVLVEALGQLNDFGITAAMSMGLGDKLQALGLGERVAALSAKG